MIKARIRWCTCRVENILTLGKLLSLWFCFLLHSILFLISQTSYRTYKIISSYELARPIMGTIFLVPTPGCIFLYVTTLQLLFQDPLIGRAKRAPHMGCSIEISRDIMSVCRMSVVCQINCVGGITCGPRACSKSVKPVTPVLFISYTLEL